MESARLIAGLGRSYSATAGTTTDTIATDLVVKFHAGIRSGAYLSVEDFREEHKDQPKALEKISAKDKCL
jgi:hypothetical protein